MKFPYVLAAAVAAICMSPALVPFVTAGEPAKGPDAAAAKPVSRVLEFGDGAARFHVERDAKAGRMTFRLDDPSVKLERAPVVVMTTDSGPKEITLVPVAGQPGTWVWTGDAVRDDRFSGTMRVVVAGKPYSAPFATAWTGDSTSAGCTLPSGGFHPRHGGHALAFPDCGARVEVVQDPATGALTIYSNEDVTVTSAPVITVTERTTPVVVTLTKVDGQDGVWTTTHESFKSTTTSARVRLLVNGKPCETALVYATTRGGDLVTVTDGPSFEVVRDAKSGAYTFYAVEETWEGKPYTVENPTVVVDGRTYNLKRVEGEPRAWQLVGLDTAGSDARDGQLNFTLFGKTLSTRVGLSGLGVGVK
ncbi:MAG: hypothetical protein U1E39_06250 [Planctomycetota bacterium]